jgi:hypothetical protein
MHPFLRLLQGYQRRDRGREWLRVCLLLRIIVHVLVVEVFEVRLDAGRRSSCSASNQRTHDGKSTVYAGSRLRSGGR